MTDLRYPIGTFQLESDDLTDAQRGQFIDQVAEVLTQLRNAVKDLSAEQLATPYRPEGWTVRQVAHHLPDSHMNAYTRFKLALTEAEPTIKPYDEAGWAELADGRDADIEASLVLLVALHKRWDVLLRSLSATDFKRTFRHPELGLVSLNKCVALYAWHGRHHIAQITSLRERLGWS